MIAIAQRQKPEAQSADWHADFLAMLPAIRRQARISFLSVPPEARDELVQEVVANCWAAYRRLVQLNKTDIAYPSALARFAVKQVREGRRVAGRIAARDVLCEHGPHGKRYRVNRLDHLDRGENGWQEIVVEDRRAGPAEIACCRIDFAAWLRLLPRRQRRIALSLAKGESTSGAAKLFGLTAARISQLRLWLRESWQRYQGEFALHEGQIVAA
jgi:hypothetical protein